MPGSGLRVGEGGTWEPSLTQETEAETGDEGGAAVLQRRGEAGERGEGSSPHP